jgi:hypothetical protein
MTDLPPGFTPHDGKTRPLTNAPQTLVDTFLGYGYESGPRQARNWMWDWIHGGKYDDVLGYRIHKSDKERIAELEAENARLREENANYATNTATNIAQRTSHDCYTTHRH